MHKVFKKLMILLISALLILSLVPASAFAAGYIDPAKDIEFTISYRDIKGLPNARFDLYKVAEADKYADLILTPEFDALKDKITGLSNINSLKGSDWSSLTDVLKAEVLYRAFMPAATGRTDAEGSLSFTLKAGSGLYLVLGGMTTQEYGNDIYIYTPKPYLVFVPEEDITLNEWSYSVTSFPKYDEELYVPDIPGGGSKDVSREVLKVWDDKGYETLRPQSVTVHLLCDGLIYDTQVLSAANNWRYIWEKLSTVNDWQVVEEDTPNYTKSMEIVGSKYVITNTYSAKNTLIPEDPPVRKMITGDEPAEASDFVFVLAAKDKAYPMPEGSRDGKKEVVIKGAGSTEFGRTEFTEEGTYTYTVSEKNTGEKGYAYDKTVYTIEYKVTESADGKLESARTIRGDDGKKTEVIEFTNKYRMPGSRLPQTGSLWWPVPVLACAGLALVMAGIILRRRNTDEEN